MAVYSREIRGILGAWGITRRCCRQAAERGVNPNGEAMIAGTICDGAGGASKVPDDVQAERCEVAGMQLQRGTLNVSVNDLNVALKALGEAMDETQKDSKVGPLQWWPVKIKWQGEVFSGYVVRHQLSKTKYLEVVSDTHFRKEGALDGDAIELVPHKVG